MSKYFKLLVVVLQLYCSGAAVIEHSFLWDRLVNGKDLVEGPEEGFESLDGEGKPLSESSDLLYRFELEFCVSRGPTRVVQEFLGTLYLIDGEGQGLIGKVND